MLKSVCKFKHKILQRKKCLEFSYHKIHTLKISGIISDLHNQVLTLYLKVVKITNHSQRININDLNFFSFLFLFSTFDSFNLKSHRHTVCSVTSKHSTTFYNFKKHHFNCKSNCNYYNYLSIAIYFKVEKIKNVHLSVSLCFTVFKTVWF